MGSKRSPSTSLQRTFILAVSSAVLGALLSTGYWYGTTQGCPPSLPYGWRDEYTTHSEGGKQAEVTRASGDVERRGSMPTNITCRISTAILTKQ
ncbi:hypothetical protein FOZ63_019550 [Perkinsus olseni]|uniref:Uncharacterized protein n=1 Tax=Perkinsus olseni TaxID=32597 RepID=A0A7J6NIN0_PEROL|nr:hypothetical protein FOZ63_019550 [Perkinsus olseni]